MRLPQIRGSVSDENADDKSWRTDQHMINQAIVATEVIERSILILRDQRVMLDSALADLYGVPVKVLNQAVKRNIERFPADFMFQLNDEEDEFLRSQFVISNPRHGGRRYFPYAFTEQGVAMLSSVLRSEHAVQVNVEIMRTFVRLRRLLQQNAGLSEKLMELERKYDNQFKAVFDAIRAMMKPKGGPKQPIGFRHERMEGNTSSS